MRGCRALVRGHEVDASFVLAVGGPPAHTFLDGQPHRDDYWLRVWGLRGLLWVWADEAVAEIRLALTDPEWRVREMALKVVARHRLDELFEEVLELKRDTTARVHLQAVRCEAVLVRNRR